MYNKILLLTLLSYFFGEITLIFFSGELHNIVVINVLLLLILCIFINIYFINKKINKLLIKKIIFSFSVGFLYSSCIYLFIYPEGKGMTKTRWIVAIEDLSIAKERILKYVNLYGKCPKSLYLLEDKILFLDPFGDYFKYFTKNNECFLYSFGPDYIDGGGTINLKDFKVYEDKSISLLSYSWLFSWLYNIRYDDDNIDGDIIVRITAQ